MFEQTQITENTKVLVKNLEVLRAMSKIVASSDAEYVFFLSQSQNFFTKLIL